MIHYCNQEQELNITKFSVANFEKSNAMFSDNFIN